MKNKDDVSLDAKVIVQSDYDLLINNSGGTNGATTNGGYKNNPAANKESRFVALLISSTIAGVTVKTNRIEITIQKEVVKDKS